MYKKIFICILCVLNLNFVSSSDPLIEVSIVHSGSPNSNILDNPLPDPYVPTIAHLFTNIWGDYYPDITPWLGDEYRWVSSSSLGFYVEIPVLAYEIHIKDIHGEIPHDRLFMVRYVKDFAAKAWNASGVVEEFSTSQWGKYATDIDIPAAYANDSQLGDHINIDFPGPSAEIYYESWDDPASWSVVDQNRMRINFIILVFDANNPTVALQTTVGGYFKGFCVQVESWWHNGGVRHIGSETYLSETHFTQTDMDINLWSR